MTKQDVFLVVGLGLMGGSYAMGLSKRGYSVYGIDKDAGSIAWALQNGLVAGGAAADDEEAVRGLLARADYLILGLYPGHILPWLEQYRLCLKPGAMLTDLAGVKSSFVPQAQQLLGPTHEFIPSHPMAGRELSGVQNANDAMFFGANFLITPTGHNSTAGIAFARRLAETLGFGRITELGLQEHDRMIGYVSQLTHAIAVSLMNANDNPALPAVTGDSFRDLTRIADINETLWSELFLANAPLLVPEIEQFSATLEDLRQKLSQGDKAGLEELFRNSTRRRRKFNKP